MDLRFSNCTQKRSLYSNALPCGLFNVNCCKLQGKESVKTHTKQTAKLAYCFNNTLNVAFIHVVIAAVYCGFTSIVLFLLSLNSTTLSRGHFHTVYTDEITFENQLHVNDGMGVKFLLKLVRKSNVWPGNQQFLSFKQTLIKFRPKQLKTFMQQSCYKSPIQTCTDSLYFK